MPRFHRLGTAAFLATVALGCVAVQASEKKAAPPLADALADWVTLLEKDDPKTAGGRWARDPEAVKAMEESWPDLKECHKEFNYRAWIDGGPASGGAGAKQLGDATEFTVGGHSHGHYHVVWVKGDAGWRVGKVFACR